MNTRNRVEGGCTLVLDSTLFSSPEALSLVQVEVEQVSSQRGWPVFYGPMAQAMTSSSSNFFLSLEPQSWVAYWADQPKWKGLRFDYTTANDERRLKQAGARSEGVIKALGRFKPESILDCTAGSGQDALLLATSGAQVTALERHPLIYLLLNDALARGRAHTQLNTLFERVRLLEGDATEFLCACQRGQFDVVYCDPMFPQRSKSALVTKTMQFFHALLNEALAHPISENDSDGGNSADSRDSDRADSNSNSAMVHQALKIAARRVIVKRPVKAPPVINTPLPNQSVQVGKLVRFDVYLTR